jgi:hypothetical protein
MSGTVVTSPAAAYSTAAFSNAEKVDIRRFCGYPTYGAGATGFQSWRYFTAYGLLEYRLNNFAAEETQTVRYLLAQMYTLESAIWNASALLGTEQAAVFIRNKNEIADRTNLFNQQRTQLCNVVGVPPGPNLHRGAAFDVVI